MLRFQHHMKDETFFVTNRPINGYSNAAVDGIGIATLIVCYLAFAGNHCAHVGVYMDLSHMHAFVVFFWLDRVAVDIAGIEEHMPLWLNVIHWLMTWPTLVAVCCIPNLLNCDLIWSLHRLCITSFR